MEDRMDRAFFGTTFADEFRRVGITPGPAYNGAYFGGELFPGGNGEPVADPAAQDASTIGDEAAKQGSDGGASPHIVMSEESIERLLGTSSTTEEQAEQQPTPSLKTALETRNSRPRKPSNKPPSKAGSVSKKNQPQSQKQPTEPSSSKPTCLEDLFGEDDQQQPPPEDNGPSKKPELAQPKAKAMPKRQNKPKKTWQFPASSKAIKQLLRHGPTPKFVTHLERKAWHSAGWKAAMEADNLKALKKASGHDVSTSESDDNTDSEEETTSGPNIQPKIRHSEKNVKAKEIVKKQAAAAAKNIAAKQREESEKPQESMVDIIEKQMQAQEAPRRSQRSVSREPPTEPKKTLFGPVNPEKPPNLGPTKSKPSASTFRKPRASQF